MQSLGTRRLQGGGDTGFFSGLSELFVDRERLEVFACPNCGCVEFFVEGVGQQNRSATNNAEQPVRRAPTSVERAEGQLHEGSLHEAHGQLEAAVAHYEQVIVKYPGTTLAKDAEVRLRAIKDKLGI
jgi:4-hydroxy-3-methylbut-2-en-1-yl diphosphate synthase IspG/GcpE